MVTDIFKHWSLTHTAAWWEEDMTTVTMSFEYKGNRLVLPLNPDHVKVTRTSPAQKAEVIGIGEVSTPQETKLATIEISSFFWSDRGDQTAKQYADWFKTWQRSKAPARWVVEASGTTAAKLLGPLWVTCEAFDYDIRAGEESDVYYDLKLLEYRPHGARTVAFEIAPAPSGGGQQTLVEMVAPPPRVNTKPATPNPVKTKKGDTLTSLALSVANTATTANAALPEGLLAGMYGTYTPAFNLYQANKTAIGDAIARVDPANPVVVLPHELQTPPPTRTEIRGVKLPVT